MRYLFFTNTPAHVHLYKHVVRRLEERGHDVLVLGRDYGCTEALLSYYDLPFEIYGHCDTSKFSLLRELPRHYLGILTAVRRFDPDLVFGMGSYAAHAGALTGTSVILILDSEPTKLDTAFARPFARYVLTPHPFSRNLGPKHHEFHGYKETAYLHPDVFEPREGIRDMLGVGPEETYAVVRFNAFGSHHDVGHEGFTPTERRDFVEALSDRATVFVSDEGDHFDCADLEARPYDLHPALMHDALAEADLLVADTQTMVTEAALLGTPAIRSNSFVAGDDMGNFRELEDSGLVENIERYERVLDRALTILSDDRSGHRWRQRRAAHLEDMVNLTDVIVDIAENEGAVERVNRVTSRSEAST